MTHIVAVMGAVAVIVVVAFFLMGVAVAFFGWPPIEGPRPRLRVSAVIRRLAVLAAAYALLCGALLGVVSVLRALADPSPWCVEAGSPTGPRGLNCARDWVLPAPLGQWIGQAALLLVVLASALAATAAVATVAERRHGVDVADGATR